MQQRSRCRPPLLFSALTGAAPPQLQCLQSSFGSSDGSDWDSYFDEEKERCFLVGVQVGAAFVLSCVCVLVLPGALLVATSCCLASNSC